MPEISRAFRAERNEALHRVLRALPADFLVALIEGLERADRIVAGRLFAGESGGCAVGVTLRAVEPGLRGRRMIWGRLARRSVVRLERGIAKGITHLHALEQVFDRSIDLATSEHPDADRHEVAKAVALWVAAEARTELLLREMNAAWLDALAVKARSPRMPVEGPRTVPVPA
jgi:hypothetical protein